jgi:hypothetical protein
MYGVRDLCAEMEEYRTAFGRVGTVQRLVGLLESSAAPDTVPLTHIAAQALNYLAENDGNRDHIRYIYTFFQRKDTNDSKKCVLVR